MARALELDTTGVKWQIEAKHTNQGDEMQPSDSNKHLYKDAHYAPLQLWPSVQSCIPLVAVVTAWHFDK